MGRARLHPCRHSPPKLSFRAVRSRALRGEDERGICFLVRRFTMSQFSYIERFVSGHGFSRAATVLQSCHSEPSATALARRELALSEAKGHARNLLLVRRFTYEPIFLHRRFVSGHGFTGCGKSLNRDDSPPQGLKPSLVLHDLRGAKAPLYHSAAGFRDFFRSLFSRAAK